MEAAVRELHEETGLTATRTLRLFMWESDTNRRNVFRIEADGEVRIGPEIRGFLWWGRRENLPTHSYVEPMLKALSS